MLFEEKNIFCNNLEIEGGVFENSKRSTIILKALESYCTFKKIVQFYIATVIVDFIEKENISSLNPILKLQPNNQEIQWINFGGQLMLNEDVENLKKKIKTNKIKSWDAIHEYYQTSNKK